MGGPSARRQGKEGGGLVTSGLVRIWGFVLRPVGVAKGLSARNGVARSYMWGLSSYNVLGDGRW